MWGFFGLPSNYSVLLHKQIFELCYYGNGFTQMDVYRLPVHLRNFYYNELVKAKKKENDDVKQSQKNTPKTTSPNVRVRR